jgi:DNA-binding transcriptional ArsR family regulator
MNITLENSIAEKLAGLFELIGQPTRLKIFLVIGENEACVCHLEAVLGIRQAAISQHLMTLRNAELLVSNRDGRRIFYRMAKPELFTAICQVAAVAGVSIDELKQLARTPVANCACPHCNPE